MRANLNDVDTYIHTYLPKVIPRIVRLRYARPAIKNQTFPDPSSNDFYKLSAEKRFFKIGRYLTELEANTIFSKMQIKLKGVLF